jgi:hypothetical protein
LRSCDAPTRSHRNLDDFVVSVTIVMTPTYVLLVMRADNDGHR